MTTTTTGSPAKPGDGPRAALRAALLDLTSDRTDISATDLCSLAGVDEETFTATVASIPALAAETVEALIRNAAEEWIRDADGSDSAQDLAESIVARYWRLVARHRELHRWVLGSEGFASTQNDVIHIITWAVLHEFTLARPSGDAATLAAQARMIAGGMYAQLVAWLGRVSHI